MAVMTFAAIDIGSYEVSMKIFELSKKIGFRELNDVRYSLELGKGVYSNGKLDTQMLDVLCETLNDFKRMMQDFGVVEYRACGTSALRELANPLIIVEQIYRRTGFKVEILSNAEQHFLGYKSIAAIERGFKKMIQKGTAILDVGGGSLQVSLFDKDALVTTQSLKMGSLRIRQRLQELEKTTIHYDKLVEEFIRNDLTNFQRLYLKDRDIKNVILMGDFITDMIFQEEMKDKIITRNEFMKRYEDTVDKTEDVLAQEMEIDPEYASLVVPTMVVCRSFIDIFQAEALWAPGVSLLDGIAYDYAEKKKFIRSVHNFENDILACAQNIAKRYELSAICRSDMKEPVHEGIPVVVLDTIGELGRLYSLGDIIFVGGSLVKTGGHNILEPAAHGKPILVGPHMFNFKEIFALLNSRNACEQVKNGKELTAMVLRLCNDRDLAKKMGQNCMDIIKENRGATRRNTQELRLLFEKHQIIP